jgi:uncharacterized membrane protein
MVENKRLLFLDFCRSVAIIMMLQGHFISNTLDVYPSLIARIHIHDNSVPFWFNFWATIRGFTAPLFFIITGTVFTYLLHQELKLNKESYWKMTRVKKGVKRVAVLLITGYILQLNLKYLEYYFKGNFNPHFLGFHILQCIGLSILLILILTPFLRIMKKFIWLGYIVLSILIFILTSLFRKEIGVFPNGVNVIFQNIIQGPDTVFSILPWTGFVFFGAAFGHYLSVYGQGKNNRNVYIFLLSCGLFFHLISVLIYWIYSDYNDQKQILFLWVYERIFEISLLILFLTFLSKFKFLQSKYLLGIGKETFIVYVLHAILLYGAVTGMGLRSLWEQKLSYFESIAGSIVFVCLFILIAQFIPRIRQVIHKSILGHGKPDA